MVDKCTEEPNYRFEVWVDFPDTGNEAKVKSFEKMMERTLGEYVNYSSHKSAAK